MKRHPQRKTRGLINWSALARSLGVDPSYVHHARAGHPRFQNPRIVRAIKQIERRFPREAA
jgi:hypothetical protein